jgi:hypothetical protein
MQAVGTVTGFRHRTAVSVMENRTPPGGRSSRAGGNVAIGPAPGTYPGHYECHQLGGSGQMLRRGLSVAASGPGDTERDRGA